MREGDSPWGGLAKEGKGTSVIAYGDSMIIRQWREPRELQLTRFNEQRGTYAYIVSRTLQND